MPLLTHWVCTEIDPRFETRERHRTQLWLVHKLAYSWCQSQTWINGRLSSERESGVKLVPHQTCRSICCGDSLGNKGEAQRTQPPSRCCSSVSCCPAHLHAGSIDSVSDLIRVISVITDSGSNHSTPAFLTGTWKNGDSLL